MFEEILRDRKEMKTRLRELMSEFGEYKQSKSRQADTLLEQARADHAKLAGENAKLAGENAKLKASNSGLKVKVKDLQPKVLGERNAGA
jgi:predicted nuclease with TOPRIM domain